MKSTGYNIMRPYMEARRFNVSQAAHLIYYVCKHGLNNQSAHEYFVNEVGKSEKKLKNRGFSACFRIPISLDNNLFGLTAESFKLDHWLYYFDGNICGTGHERVKETTPRYLGRFFYKSISPLCVNNVAEFAEVQPEIKKLLEFSAWRECNMTPWTSYGAVNPVYGANEPIFLCINNRHCQGGVYSPEELEKSKAEYIGLLDIVYTIIKIIAASMSDDDIKQAYSGYSPVFDKDRMDEVCRESWQPRWQGKALCANGEYMETTKNNINKTDADDKANNKQNNEKSEKAFGKSIKKALRDMFERTKSSICMRAGRTRGGAIHD